MSEEREAAIRSEIVGRDIDAAREMFEDAYNGSRFSIEPIGDEFSYRYTSVGDSELSLRGTFFSGSIQGDVETIGEYVVSWLTSGEGATDLSSEPVHLVAGRPAVFVNNRPAAFEFAAFRQNLMHFDGAFLEHVAGDHEGAVGPLLFDSTAVPTGAALQAWATTVARVARTIYDPTSTPLMRSEANRTAAVSLLDTFPHATLAVPAEVLIPAAGKVRIAVEYMYTNAHLPLRTETIAQVAGMSVRSLQSVFKRELGVTPLDYLRRIRLDRVRDELRRCDRGTVTVAEVARRWGFTHLGRFSASYAERFGEHPRSTLR